ncbi:VWA domain-containing protein [Candidatus Sumerlaeota bacterium]|nr:VWA domain-containing protein [Candidatus Sumerlaeota bacterium]
MEWHSPQQLYWIFALPLLIAFFVWALRRKRRLLERFASWPMIQLLASNASLERQIIKFGMITTAVALTIIALARPQYGRVEREVLRRGMDIIVAVDVSTSMLASDIPPTRLERAKQQLSDLIDNIEMRQGDRVGIMVFAGDAFLACPLTVDYFIARQFLESVNPATIAQQGTMLGTAIHEAVRAFERSESDGDRLLIMLTDGEDQGSDPAAAAQAAKSKGVKIYTIGIGSEQGEPIRLPDGSFKKDQDGKIVTSRLDFNTLQQVALETGGKAIKALESGFEELEVISRDIESMKRAQLSTKTFSLKQERYQWLLAPAALLLMFEMLIGVRRRLTHDWKGRFE